jgi:hypothetical protein
MATKTKNTRGTKSRKRPTEKPVDAEILRAAARAGILTPDPRIPPHLPPKPALTPEAERQMLVDALDVIHAAESTFYVDGLDDSPISILREALGSIEQEMADLVSLHEGRTLTEWQTFWRVEHRARLALKLAEFRETHGDYEARDVAGLAS